MGNSTIAPQTQLEFSASWKVSTFILGEFLLGRYSKKKEFVR